jgi:hypothetical protein
MADHRRSKRHNCYDATLDLLGGCIGEIPRQVDIRRERRGTPEADPAEELDFLRRVVEADLGGRGRKRER